MPLESRTATGAGRREYHDLFDEALAHVRVFARYDCAGIDQEPDDPRRCGKCGPCRAAEFLKRWKL